MLKLSPSTQSLVEKTFAASERAEVTRRLTEGCGNNLPFCGRSDEYQMERIRFAVLKISKGDVMKLREAIELAQRDWRDVLVWAGFGNSLTVHEEWAKEILGEK